MGIFGTSEDWITNKRWIKHNFIKSLEKMEAMSW